MSTSAQRWYAVEHHTHGKGRWVRCVSFFPSRVQAHAWALDRGWIPREKAVSAARQAVYRVVEVAELALIEEDA